MKKRNIYKFAAVVTFIMLWSLILFFLGPQRLIAWLGSENALLITFIVASLGGVSMFTAVSFYSTLVTFAVGGVNPILLGIVGGCGVSIGDSLFYYLGKSGRKALVGKPKEWAQEFSEWMKRRPKWMIPIITFVYACAVPLPNDILTVSLGLSHTKYRTIILPLLLGNILLTVFIAYLASVGWYT